MKNKFIVLFSLLIFVVTLSGCQATSNPISDNDFDMKFNTLDKENNVADFTVFGYPNEEEQAQILEVVTSSLKNQEVKGSIKVNLYSNFQDLKKEKEPFYGTLEYENEKITKNNLNIPAQEEYLKYASY